MNPVFFTDRDLGKRFPDTLAAAGLAVERHHDFFQPDGSDEQWLEYVGENGRIALTHNERIRYTPNELAAVVRHSVRLLVIVGKVPLPALAANFVATLPKIEAFIATHQPPYIAKVFRVNRRMLLHQFLREVRHFDPTKRRKLLELFAITDKCIF